MMLTTGNFKFAPDVVQGLVVCGLLADSHYCRSQLQECSVQATLLSIAHGSLPVADNTYSTVYFCCFLFTN